MEVINKFIKPYVKDDFAKSGKMHQGYAPQILKSTQKILNFQQLSKRNPYWRNP